LTVLRAENLISNGLFFFFLLLFKDELFFCSWESNHAAHGAAGDTEDLHHII
jgi:hypothetical protein